MSPGKEGTEVLSLQDYVRVVRRRWLVVLPVAVLIPLVVVLLSRDHERYRASAQVLLSSSLTDFGRLQESAPAAERAAETEARLAATPPVARAALRATGVRDRSARAFLRNSSVTVHPTANLLRFLVADRDPHLAVRLATNYAREFTAYRRRLNQTAIEAARRDVLREIHGLRRDRRTRSPVYRALVARAKRLELLQAVQTGKALVAAPAEHATRVEPRALRNGILAAGVALIVAVLLAFLAQALDSRVRSADEVSDVLPFPLLGRLRKPQRRLRRRNKLAMLAEPNGAEAESFRLLRSNLDSFNLEFSARTIMLTSALPREGKSTIAANLAVAFARTGRRVILVDLDLRRPSLGRFFELSEPTQGLSDAALGRISARDVLVPVEVSGLEVAPGSNGRAVSGGRLDLMLPGTVPPNVGDLVASDALGNVLAELRSLADVVVIDGPPLLGAGDAMALGARVDAFVVVVRLNKVRRQTLRELRRLLDASTAGKLGFVLSGAELDREYWTTIRNSTRRTGAQRRAQERAEGRAS